ncbi:MAG: ribonuclease E/G [Sarcina sp.]
MREIFIERREKILRVAIKDNNELSEFYIEEDSKRPVTGELYKGIVRRIVPSVNGLFIDIGYEKDVYMPFETGYEKLKVGSELIVEVIKEEIAKKAARVSSRYSIVGRYIVLETRHKNLVFSKKINNRGFEKELKSILKKPEDVGITIRTNAADVSLYEIQKELSELYEVYEDIKRKCKYELKPMKVYDNKSLINRIVKDFITEETKSIKVDSENDLDYLSGLLKETSIKLEFHKDVVTLFAYYNIEKAVLSLRNDRVNLKCGGNIVIEKTEAMYTIDVNTAHNNKKSNNDTTAADITNIEAAKEIAKQIRLRNISGIIVIDFIESFNELAKEKVLNILNTELKKDKQKAKVYDFTELGLVQIARARRGKSVYEFLEEECYRCKGTGNVLKLSYIYLLIKNEILRWTKENNIKDFHINLNNLYKANVEGNLFEFLTEIGSLNLNIYLTFEDAEEFYKVEPLIFKNQIENVKSFLVTNIEKY